MRGPAAGASPEAPIRRRRKKIGGFVRDLEDMRHQMRRKPHAAYSDDIVHHFRNHFS